MTESLFPFDPIVPAVRSSDASMVGDPFRYLLTRRLGLARPSYLKADALRLGTWFHAAATGDLGGATQKTLWDKTEATLRQDCRDFGHVDVASVVEHERRLMDTALAWYCEAVAYPIPNLGRIERYFLRPHIRVLGKEILLWDPATRALAQLDFLIYDEIQNALIIGDWKTTVMSPSERANTCTVEFQTWHYLMTTTHLLPLIREKYGLPKDVRVSGMMHVIVQKPPLTYSDRTDRPFVLTHREITRGKNKGEIRAEKSYTSDKADPEVYAKRVRDWYRGEGPYADEKPNRLIDPPINLSVTSIGALDDHMQDYLAITDRLLGLATGNLTDQGYVDRMFYRNLSASYSGHGGPGVFEKFYFTPLDRWGALCLECNVRVEHRDPPDLLACTEPTIKETLTPCPN